MLGTKRVAAVLMSVTALLSTSVAVPASASASPYECEVALAWEGRPVKPQHIGGGTDCTLRNGSNWYASESWGYGREGSGVYGLQMSLRHCHGQNITVDGWFGRGTEQALKNVQGYLRITRDGVFGPQTSSRMAWPVGSDAYERGYGFSCTTARPAGPGPLSDTH